MGPNAKGAALALISFGIFATHDVIVKFLGGRYDAFQIVFFSVLFSFPLVTLMMVRETEAHTLRPRHPWWTALRTVSVVVTGVSAFYAFSTLTLAETYAIMFSAPLLITILAIPILGERVGPRRWAAVVVGLVGVIVVLRPGAGGLGIGHLAALVAAMGGALASIIVRKIGKEERSDVLMLYPMLANLAVTGAALPFVYQPVQPGDIAMMALMSILAFAAMLTLIAAYRTGEAAIVAPMQYSQILWAAVYGALFFNETSDIATGTGAVIIIASGLYIVLRESQPNASENTPVSETKTRIETGTFLRVGPLLRSERRRQKQTAAPGMNNQT
ncbi:MAG: DMT family transporter [Rhodobacteraceae bacterium]|nr:DMT family transporter [Paracoccaceae bacterium]